jgi:hypothetical protein
MNKSILCFAFIVGLIGFTFAGFVAITPLIAYYGLVSCLSAFCVPLIGLIGGFFIGLIVLSGIFSLLKLSF